LCTIIKYRFKIRVCCGFLFNYFAFLFTSSSPLSNRYSILRLKTIKCQSSQDQDTMAIHSTYFFFVFMYIILNANIVSLSLLYVNVNTCHFFLTLIIQKHVRILIFYVNFIWFTCVCLSVCIFQQNWYNYLIAVN
jgi:hypothetical protein